MQSLLTDHQKARQAEFKAFVCQSVEPFAEEWERKQKIPESVVLALAELGYMGGNLPAQYGGQGWDTVTFGLLCEALGRGSSSLAGVLTVQTMVSRVLLKWGSTEQKQKWIPRLAKGEVLGAFALTEPSGGSDLDSLETAFSEAQPGFLLLNGVKKWITWAQFASVFLVFGKLGNASLACLVPRDASGLEVEPIDDLMGFRAAGLGRLVFKSVVIPESNVVGKPGFALSHVAPVGLQYGRISTACSALGVLRGCVEESSAWAATRKIGNERLGNLGMMRSLIAEMGTDLEAGGFLCYNACRAANENLPEAFESAIMAKYFTSKAAVRAASNAVQIRGAAGCHGSSPASRFYRDAKIMEIIEGTTQIHEHLLGGMFVRRARRLLQ